MRALVADRHDLFRQSLSFLLNELPNSAFKIREASCPTSLFKELKQFNYNLILVGTNIFTNNVAPNHDILQIRHHHPESSLVLIEEVEDEGPAFQYSGGLVCDDVLHKTSCSSVFLKTLEDLIASKQHTAKAPCKNPTPTSSLYTGRAAKLTPRQQEVLKLLAFGQSNRQIAARLKLSEGTIKVHVTAIFRAFDVRNRTQAMLMARRMMEKSKY